MPLPSFQHQQWEISVLCGKYMHIKDIIAPYYDTLMGVLGYGMLRKCSFYGHERESSRTCQDHW